MADMPGANAGGTNTDSTSMDSATASGTNTDSANMDSVSPAAGGTGGGGYSLLLTGTSGYIAAALEKWLLGKDDVRRLDRISLRAEDWREADFSQYDCIIHLAGLVHQDERRGRQERQGIRREQQGIGPEPEEGAGLADLYDRVNRILTRQLAEKAKAEGVRHFIFFSTMAVYGKEEALSRGGGGDGAAGTGNAGADTGVISEATVPEPKSLYGKSKLAAEKELLSLRDEGFAVTVIRPPTVYGPGCPGNYQTLRKMVLLLKFFPRYQNQRSMIFIDNLCELVRLIIMAERDRASRGGTARGGGAPDGTDSDGTARGGIYMPQNREPVTTWQMAEKIAYYNRSFFRCTRLLNPPAIFAGRFSSKVRKAIGSLTYDRRMSAYFDYQYCVCGFRQSMEKTECS